jgi:hypothetical protein
MRLIWLATHAHARAIATPIASITFAAAIACGTGDDASGATEGSSGGTPTSTEAMTTMSGGQTSAPTSQTAGSSSDSGEPTDDTATSAPTDTGTGSSGPSSTEGSGSSGSGSDGDSSSTGEPATDTGTESTGGIMSQACTDGCEVEFTCGIRWASAEECTEWCNANLGFAADFSPFCMQAWEELSACLGTLDCTQYMQWQAPVEFPYPCYQEDDALAFECDGQ